MGDYTRMAYDERMQERRMRADGDAEVRAVGAYFGIRPATLRRLRDSREPARRVAYARMVTVWEQRNRAADAGGMFGTDKHAADPDWRFDDWDTLTTGDAAALIAGWVAVRMWDAARDAWLFLRSVWRAVRKHPADFVMTLGLAALGYVAMILWLGGR